MTATPPRSRRRAAPRTFGGRTSGLPAAALLLVAAAAAALTFPSGEVASPGKATAGAVVTHSVVACPSTPVGPGGRSRVVAGVAPGVGLGTGGTVRQGSRSGAGRPLRLERGQLGELGDPSSATVLSGSGDLAAGLFGFRDDSSANPQTRAVTGCAAPSATWWFTGGGAGLDHSSVLVLSNIDSGPAVVDVQVLGPDGKVDTVGTRGIPIGPGASRRIVLSDIAPQTDDLALGISASRGRVVASVADAFAPGAGATPGREWLQGDTTPSRVVRLAGLPDRATSRTLLIANPSEREAVVQVRVAGRDGEFAPAGLEEQTVAPGSVRTVDLGTKIGRKEAVAVRLRSHVRILGAVRSVDGADTTYTSPVVPLSGPAAAPVAPDGTTAVQLTAGALPVTASVVAYDDKGGRVDRTTVKVAATSTAAWSPKRGAAYLVVTPVSGPVFGAVVYQGKGVSEVPLTALPIRFVQPAVVPAIR